MDIQPTNTTSATSAIGSNIFVSLLSIIFLGLQASGIEINVSADEVVRVFMSADWGAIIGLFIANLLNPILKLANKIRNNEWTWDWLGSQNFLTQSLTSVLMALATFGILFPEGAASQVIDTIFGGDPGLIIAALGINIINPLWHLIFKRK